jgi:hypothetical protein
MSGTLTAISSIGAVVMAVGGVIGSECADGKINLKRWAGPL